MLCLDCRPKELKPIPSNVDPNQESFKSQIEAFNSGFWVLPFKNRSCVALRITVLVVFILGVVALALHGDGHLTSFLQDFPMLMKQINWKWVAVGIGGFCLLSIGAFYVIARVLHQKDRITKEGIGKLSGADHWVEAFYTRDDKKGMAFPGYIDTSTLRINEKGKKEGVAFMYANKPCNEAYMVAATVLGTTPLHVVAAMVYNLIRFFVIPFYLLGCIAVEKARGEQLFKERFFEFWDIPNEMGKSLQRFAKAPFYGLAIMFAAIYAIAVDSLNGRKLGSYLERAWNEGVTRAEGWWSVRLWQHLWRFEGGGGPDGLGRNGFYLAGCWQPIAVVYYVDGELQEEGDSLSEAVSPRNGMHYHIFTRARLIKEYNKMVTELETQGSPIEVAAS